MGAYTGTKKRWKKHTKKKARFGFLPPKIGFRWQKTQRDVLNRKFATPCILCWPAAFQVSPSTLYAPSEPGNVTRRGEGGPESCSIVQSFPPGEQHVAFVRHVSDFPCFASLSDCRTVAEDLHLPTS